jgi:hypothetical protein
MWSSEDGHCGLFATTLFASSMLGTHNACGNLLGLEYNLYLVQSRLSAMISERYRNTKALRPQTYGYNRLSARDSRWVCFKFLCAVP